jgi:hypothetical protein
MFERYTEKARRTIFFARYEASQFGASYIETEHLLLGLFREDKALARQFIGSFDKLEAIRDVIAKAAKPGEKVSTSVDMPLSQESQRVLAYAAEEAERMKHEHTKDEHLGTPHLLLGLLREEKSFAAQLLREQGLTLERVREQVRRSEARPAQEGSGSIPQLEQLLAELETRGAIRSLKQMRFPNKTASFAIYPSDPSKENQQSQEMTPAEKLAQIQRRIDFIMEEMERAIVTHEFEKARFYSGEESKERENLRRLCEQYHLEAPPRRVPVLRIEIIRGDRFSDVQQRCDEYLAQGVAQVWLLDPDSRRAYTATQTEGLREFKGEILRIANPALEMDLKKIFD